MKIKMDIGKTNFGAIVMESKKGGFNIYTCILWNLWCIHVVENFFFSKV